MRVVGPAWPSTERLREALREVPPADKVVHYGAGGKDALEQFRAFAEAGLNVPEWTRDVEVAKKWVREGHLVFGRRLHHTQGNDIVGPGRRERAVRANRRWNGPQVQVRETWNPTWLHRDFWVKVIPNVAQEWRIHVVNGRSVGRALKHLDESRIEHKRIMPVRNRKTGWVMRHDVDPLKEVREAGKRAVTALGYPMGAADLLLTEDGKVYILEVNSAPSLRDDYTLNAYVKGLSRQ